jgi:hypothetical protein
VTQVGFGPLERIDGPLPLAPLYGLLPAAEAPAAGVRIIPDVDDNGIERWLNGAEVYPYPPDDAQIFDACAPGGSSAGVKVDGGDLLHPQYGAITVYLAESCKSFKVWNQQEFIARAMAAFVAVEGAALGRHFMTGEGLPLNPHLADGGATILNSGAATNAANALALLEKAIAETGRQGLIHASPQFASALRERFAVDNKTGVIRTINGTVVIPDFGYADGSTPQGQAAPTGTQEWIYATGPVDIRRTEAFVKPDTVQQALDRGTTGSATLGRPNVYTYRVERYYLVDWDTELHAAVLSDRCDTGC